MERIEDNDRLWRRIDFRNPDFQIKEDGKPASSNFTLKKINGEFEDGLSVDLERLTTYEDSIQDEERFRLFALVAGDVRTLDLDCINNGLPHPAHSLITGELLQKKSTARKLAQLSIQVDNPRFNV